MDKMLVRSYPIFRHNVDDKRIPINMNDGSQTY